jgi:hypothetical protein
VPVLLAPPPCANAIPVCARTIHGTSTTNKRRFITICLRKWSVHKAVSRDTAKTRRTASVTRVTERCTDSVTAGWRRRPISYGTACGLLLLVLLLELLLTQLRLALLAGVERGRSGLGNNDERTARSTHVRSPDAG